MEKMSRLHRWMMGFQSWMFMAGIMMWPAYAFGLFRGGLAGTAILSILCFFVSFLCYLYVWRRN